MTPAERKAAIESMPTVSLCMVMYARELFAHERFEIDNELNHRHGVGIYNNNRREADEFMERLRK